MKEEFKLSEKIKEAFESFRTPTYNFKHLNKLREQVDKINKEFIRRLKANFILEEERKIIDKLAEDELI